MATSAVCHTCTHEREIVCMLTYTHIATQLTAVGDGVGWGVGAPGAYVGAFPQKQSSVSSKQ